MIKENTLKLIEETGGSFMKKLIEAWRYGDATNKEKIEVVWATSIERYDKYANPEPIETVQVGGDK